MRRLVRDHWPRLLLSLALLAAFFGNQGFRGLVRNWIELRHLRGEFAALELQAKAQGENLRLLRNGDRAIERMARRELGYIRKGEIEYRFPPPRP